MNRSLFELLAFMPAGRATVTIGGRPLLSVNSDERALEVDIDGAAEVGLRLSDFVNPREGLVGLLRDSLRTSGELSRLGWKLTLHAERGSILTMGNGVSRLTGRVRMNPLRLRKLLGALR